MQWAFRIRRKISAALLLAAVFVLVFLKNMVDNHNVTELGVSFSSVYEDRLVMEGYIYKLSEHLFRKKIMIDTTRHPASAVVLRSVIDSRNEAISHLVHEYEKTKLTEAETRFFSDFRRNVKVIADLEREWLQGSSQGKPVSAVKALIDTEFGRASENLGHLSGIQISEGKILNDHSKKIVAGASLLTQFEMGILIAIALMVMVLALESSAVFSKRSQDRSLN